MGPTTSQTRRSAPSNKNGCVDCAATLDGHVWTPASEADALRQGDLLQRITLPRLDVPLVTYIQGPDRHEFVCVAKEYRFAVVLTQCCSLQKSSTVAVAPLHRSKPIPARFVERLHGSPSLGEDAGALFAMYAELPLDVDTDGVDERTVPAGVLAPVIDFGLVTAVHKDSLLDEGTLRTHQMDPISRSWLRERLARYWGRVADEDIEHLPVDQDG